MILRALVVEEPAIPLVPLDEDRLRMRIRLAVDPPMMAIVCRAKHHREPTVRRRGRGGAAKSTVVPRERALRQPSRRTLRTGEAQTLTEAGPYDLVRHPGYAGSLLTWVGFAVASRSLPVVAVVAGMFAVGNILFGHFEEHTPKWRRILKLFIVTSVVALISSTAGRIWSVSLIGTMLLGVLVIHGYWLPKKYGINGWTAEPREKYYAFRGWKL